jgi:hypothetical protein
MVVAVNIRDCLDCRHRDHSGAFTEGGGVPVCGHPDSCDKKRADIIGVDQYHWRARVLNEDMSIPNWCPLLHGSKY